MDPRAAELVADGVDRDAAEVMVALSPLPAGWHHVEARNGYTIVIRELEPLSFTDQVAVDVFDNQGATVRAFKSGIGRGDAQRWSDLLDTALAAIAEDDPYVWLIVDQATRELRKSDHERLQHVNDFYAKFDDRR